MRGRHTASTREPTATYRVRFSPRPDPSASGTLREPTRRLPRVTHLLVLAHRIDGMIRACEIRDWAEAARLLGITRARMTQIGNLRLLSPRIQYGILTRRCSEGPTERALRNLVGKPEWKTQELAWGTGKKVTS
jgi:hypothetical protein